MGLSCEEENREGGVAMFKLGQIVWGKDKSKPSYHVKFFVCDITEQEGGRINVASISKDGTRLEWIYGMDVGQFELIPKQAKVV